MAASPASFCVTPAVWHVLQKRAVFSSSCPGEQVLPISYRSPSSSLFFLRLSSWSNGPDCSEVAVAGPSSYRTAPCGRDVFQSPYRSKDPLLRQRRVLDNDPLTLFKVPIPRPVPPGRALDSTPLDTPAKGCNPFNIVTRFSRRSLPWGRTWGPGRF